MEISKRAFGTLCDGTQVSCWTLTGENGLVAEILDTYDIGLTLVDHIVFVDDDAVSLRETDIYSGRKRYNVF